MSETLAPFFETLRYREGGEIAPYKPLVLLIALSALSRGGTRIGYLEAKPIFGRILARHGGQWARGRIEEPFARLRNDSDGQIWALWHDPAFDVMAEGGALAPDAARRAGLEGGIPRPWIDRFRAAPDLPADLARRLAADAFPATGAAVLRDLGLHS